MWWLWMLLGAGLALIIAFIVFVVWITSIPWFNP